MTWGISAHRRADEFETLVERSSTGTAGAPPDARDADLLALVGALRAVPEAEPRPEFVADLRGRLMAEAEAALAPPDLAKLRLPARHTRRERRLAAVFGGLAVVGATTSLAVASQSALPGESLYPIKRVIESVQSGLSVGEASKGRAELAAASHRLDEVAALTEDPGPATDEQIAQALSTFNDQAATGADLLLSDYASTGRDSSVADLRDFAATSLDRLEAVESQVPHEARDELLAAAALLAQIDAQAERACPSCGGTPIDGIPESLQAGERVVVPPAPLGNGPNADPSASATPDLPDVDGPVPPGSVLEPSTAPDVEPSAATDPLTALRDGLTGVLTGQGSSQPSDPVSTVVQGVGGILLGVLDPITGELIPSE